MALRLEILVDDKGTPVIKKFSDTTKNATKKAETQTVKSTQNMGKGYDGLKSKVMSLQATYLLMAASIGIVTTAVKKAINDTVDYRDEITKLSKATGFSTEALAGFRYAAQIGGSSTEGMTKAVRNLYRGMQDVKDGLEEGSRKFRQLGVDVLDAQGNMKDGEQVFLEVADRISKIENASEKAAIAQEIFGRSGLELVPMLNEGKAGLEKLRKEADLLGLTFDKKAGAEAEKFKDDMLRLKSATQGATQTLIGETGLIPALSNSAIYLAAGIIWIREYSKALQNDMVPQVIKAAGSVNFLNPILKYNSWVFSLFRKEIEKTQPELMTFDDIVKSLNDQMSNIKTDFDLDISTKTTGGMSDEDLKIFEEWEQQKTDTLWEQVEKRKEARFAEFENERAIIEQQIEAEQLFQDFRTQKQEENQEAILRALEFNAEIAEAEKEIQKQRYETWMDLLSSTSDALFAFAKDNKAAAGLYKVTAYGETVIETYRAAQKAYSSQFVPPTPDSPIRGAAASAAAIIAGLAKAKKIQAQKFALGGDFITSGPMPIIVGDNPGGSERVQITPLSSPNVNGPRGDVYLTFNFPNAINVTESLVRSEIIPAIQRAKDEGVIV